MIDFFGSDINKQTSISMHSKLVRYNREIWLWACTQEVVTVAPGRLANYEQSKKDFFKEHLHEHEEIRLILEGGGKIHKP